VARREVFERGRVPEEVSLTRAKKWTKTNASGGNRHACAKLEPIRGRGASERENSRANFENSYQPLNTQRGTLVLGLVRSGV